MQGLCEDCSRLFPLEAPKSFDFANLSLYYEYLRSSDSVFFMCRHRSRRCPMFSTKKKVLRSDSNLLRKLRAMIAIRCWIVLTTVFASCSLAAAADIPTAQPQIQGGNLRIEFDNRLRSRVVARFDKTETVMGPFTASETVTTADKAWTGFLLASQKHGRTKDTFGEGERLTVEGTAGTLTKIVSVTVYDVFPAMAFFEVQYTYTGTT